MMAVLSGSSELSAPRLKQAEVYKELAMLALLELFLRDSSRNSRMLDHDEPFPVFSSCSDRCSVDTNRPIYHLYTMLLFIP